MQLYSPKHINTLLWVKLVELPFNTHTWDWSPTEVLPVYWAALLCKEWWNHFKHFRWLSVSPPEQEVRRSGDLNMWVQTVCLSPWRLEVTEQMKFEFILNWTKRAAFDRSAVMWYRTSLQPGSKLHGTPWGPQAQSWWLYMKGCIEQSRVMLCGRQNELPWKSYICIARLNVLSYILSPVQNPSRYFQCWDRNSSSNIPLNNSFNGTKQIVSLACTPSQRWCYDDSLSKFQFTTHQRTTDSSLCSEWVRGRDFGHSLGE